MPQMNKETLRMQMLAGVITESEYKAKLNENLTFNQVEKNRKYFATTNFGIFKKGDEVFVDTVRNLGNEVVIELSDNKGKHDSIKGDLGEEVEVFDNTIKESLNESMIGGIVGVGAITQIPPRDKTDYEMAFEHFLGSKYDLKEEMEDNEEYFNLDQAFKNSPETASYDDVLEIVDSYGDYATLDAFQGMFPEDEEISKDEYFKFFSNYIDDMSDVEYIKANWISIFDEDIFDKAGLNEEIDEEQAETEESFEDVSLDEEMEEGKEVEEPENY